MGLPFIILGIKCLSLSPSSSHSHQRAQVLRIPSSIFQRSVRWTEMQTKSVRDEECGTPTRLDLYSFYNPFWGTWGAGSDGVFLIRGIVVGSGISYSGHRSDVLSPFFIRKREVTSYWLCNVLFQSPKVYLGYISWVEENLYLFHIHKPFLLF